MRSAPIFQPALGSYRSVCLDQACGDGLSFAAQYPVDEYAASLASGAARLELWTNLPVSQDSSESTSRPVAWNAYPLLPVKAALDRATGYSFVARLQCLPAASEGVFNFTYRIVHPDGQIDWLGSPSTDGRIHLPSSDAFPPSIRQVVLPQRGTRLELSAFQEHDHSVELATLTPGRSASATSLSFDIDASDVQSGLVIERTKSTWCTSRRFQSLHEVSPDFAAGLLVLELSKAAAGEVLVLIPIFDDTVLPPRLVRSSSSNSKVTFQIEVASPQSQVKIALALGSAAQLERTIKACRSHAARLLRTCAHEPLGLPWSAAKALEVEAPLAAGMEVVTADSKPYSEPECVDISFYSDSTAVEGTISTQGMEDSQLLSSAEDSQSVCDSDDASTIHEDRTNHADHPPSSGQPRVGFGFCTWEAMQNHERRPYLSEVVAALEAAEKRTGTGSITSLLIDDGWQDVLHAQDHRGRLSSFDMDPAMLDVGDAAHPHDDSQSVLVSYVGYIRDRFPSIRSIGCWMTLAGYWDGINPEGSIASSLSSPLRSMRIQDAFRHADREWWVPATELDMHLFWDKAFHSLRSSGIDLVKIDAQAEWEWAQGPTGPLAKGSNAMMPGGGKLGKAMFEAMEGAAARYFGSGGVIHSMAFTPALTNTARTLHSQGMTIRCTDDFFPNIPDAHRHHLAHNVYNALLLPEHVCDADMLAHCRTEADSQQDFTGYHASFRAFTDAKLWLSNRADAPTSTSMRALAAPAKLSCQSERVRVQEKGRLLSNAAFEDLIGEGAGPALKLGVWHETARSATLGLWNLRGAGASTFDVLDIEQLLQMHDQQVAVRSFRSGKTWLLSRQSSEENSGLLSATIEAGSWEVLTVAPVHVVPATNVGVAVLGSTQHFMTPEGVSLVTISASGSTDEGLKKRRSSVSRRPSHQRRHSTRSTSTCDDSASETSLIAHCPTNKLVQEVPSDSRAVLLSLALINGFFAMMQGAVNGATRTPRTAVGLPRQKSKGGRVDVVDAMLGLIDQLQTLVVFGVLILASWTFILPTDRKGDATKSWLPWRNTKEGDHGVDGKALKRVRLAPHDAVATLKRCLATRTMAPLHEMPVAITQPEPTPPSARSPLSRRFSRQSSSDVVFSCLVDAATTIGFLVLCEGKDKIKECTIDRIKYDCTATPWISISPTGLEEGSQPWSDKHSAWRVEVDMQAWMEHQDVTYVQTIAAPVRVALRIAATG
ncbi:hypothetical protein PANT_9d00179 [Moesziomyces antarcticus T-34]|uniref:Alpha-galactosidase n=1 Tax=Pseudozyma antarctica (strain T-34) TaxID=1151754 RepID=M9M0Y6_PSEA3|nr:hypothetical protein PANT_9d00179 [Moesziomyces antarcticus T-34]